MFVSSATMAASLSNPNYINKLRETNHSSFDEYTQSGENRTTRAASFGISPNASLFQFLKKTAEPITNKFMLAPPSASSINVRRHSSHNCNAAAKAAAMRANEMHVDLHTADRLAEPNHEQTSLPPVPRRTLLGKIMTARSFSESPTVRNTINKAYQQVEEVRKRNARQMPCTNDQNSDEDRLSIESVFEEPKSSDPIMLSKSNRSSSDSNKSNIDTGYMSSSNDNDRIFFGASEDFRTRFSSVDTQSSMDSGLSADYQNLAFNHNQSRCIISPLAVKRDEYDDRNGNGGKYGPRNGLNAQTKLSNNTKITNSNGVGRPLSNTSNRIQTSNNGQSRPRPPPPIRPQSSLDSGRIFHNGSMLGAFQSGIAKITSAATLTSEAVIGRKLTNAARQMSLGSSGSSNGPTKLNTRQDSTLSNDSFSMTSSPGFNTKNMESPLLQHASRINQQGNSTTTVNESVDSFSMTSRYIHNGRGTFRQDSTISNDSFNQIASPGYTKMSEPPLMTHAVKLNAIKQSLKCQDEILEDIAESACTSPLTKSVSTPASLQAIVRFQNGSRMSMQHKVVNRRKSSNPHITRGRHKFRLYQILLNAAALLIIAGGLGAYFKYFPSITYVNQTIIKVQNISNSTSSSNITMRPPPIQQPIVIYKNGLESLGKNPAPGVCLPIIVKFCQIPQVPYNYTIYPNYMGHFTQLDAEIDLEAYDALVDVKCYELVSLFLCALFVPKCGSNGNIVPPCRSLCEETMRRCKFFLSVFSLDLPEYLNCDQFVESHNAETCVGHRQMREAAYRFRRPFCSGHLCDGNRCIPKAWRCDGHVDCSDQSDEQGCNICGKDSVYCGDRRCMSSKHVCDGEINCPYGQDERNCIRLSERNGDLGQGTLEIYKVKLQKWVPACVNNWVQTSSPAQVCMLLGYNSVNASKVTIRDTNLTINPSGKDLTAIWRMMQSKRSNLIKEFASCSNDNHPVVDLTCSNYDCGKIRSRTLKQTTRIIGGGESEPGDWPFLAAILGGPEEVFYCAGVLIADQWVLTASHCVGNHSLHNINDWTIQLGITRRLSHTYYGQKVKIQRVIPHPQYNQEVLHDNDVALFQLATRVAFHEHLLPVCLPPINQGELEPGTMCTVIGWGKKEDKKSASASYEPTVNEAQVPILHRDICTEWLGQLNVTEGMICAGYAEGGKDACQGDSGGPLLCKHPNERDKYFVGGIVSWGVKCASPKLPGVYANIPRYVPWILQTMQNYSNTQGSRTMHG